MFWILFAFLSAALLGFYDVFKKLSLRDNAVIPVLVINTVVCNCLFFPFIIGSAVGWIVPTESYFVPLEKLLTCGNGVVFYLQFYPVSFLVGVERKKESILAIIVGFFFLLWRRF